ncbi:CAP domain-containing protein [Nocardioides sp. R1-1]|uniref:CAP domain-containing protein n=1 Tax=Nocardioides sp. R1-1 TaxID=3383502 RepID=UPI0038D0EE49
MMLPVRSASLLLTVLATAVVTVLPAAPPAAPAAPAAPASQHGLGSDSARREVRLLGQVNAERRRAGCRRLRSRAALHASAAAHSAAMAAYGGLSHQVPGERSLEQRIADAGYRNARLMAEVVAAGPRSPREALRSWLDSPPHRAVILDCRLRLAGLGVHERDGTLWWTVDLVRR